MDIDSAAITLLPKSTKSARPSTMALISIGTEIGKCGHCANASAPSAFLNILSSSLFIFGDDGYEKKVLLLMKRCYHAITGDVASKRSAFK